MPGKVSPEYSLLKFIFQTGLILAYIGIMVLAVLDTHEWQETFMIMNLVLCVILNTFRAIFRGTNT